MGQDEILVTLDRRRQWTDRYYTTGEVRKLMQEDGLMPPGYARVHYGLMMLAKYDFIEMEAPPVNRFREWIRRFRAKPKVIA